MGSAKVPGRRSQPGGSEAVWAVAAGAVLSGLLLVLGVWLAAQLGGAGHGSPIGWGRAVAERASADPELGERAPRVWSSAASVWLAVLAVLGLVAAALGGLGWWRWSKDREWTDARAKHLSSPRDVADFRKDAVTKKARALGSSEAGIGLFMGQCVGNGGARLWTNVESLQLWFMGPRSGKTSGLVTRHLFETTFPAIMTANKADGVHETRGARSEIGTCLVQDPQQIIHEPPGWYYPPQNQILARDDKVFAAEELAGIFDAAKSLGPGEKVDAFFGPGGETLLADLLLAVAVAGERLTLVYDWLSYPDPRTAPRGILDPVEVLRRHGHHTAADDLQSYRVMTPKTRDGLYAQARLIMKFLREPAIRAWYEPLGPTDNRPVFDPQAFVTSTDTLYLLSREGKGTARALTAATVNAVVRAALEQATVDGGRLQTPLLAELDEATNICRLTDLPDWFSYFGSVGILLSVQIQSREQAVNTWGEHQLRVMLSNATVMGVGRGLRDEHQLAGLVKLINDYDEVQRSRTRGARGHHSVSDSIAKREVFSIADLAAMPAGRALIFPAGARPSLIKIEGWFKVPALKTKGEESKAVYAERARELAAAARRRRAEEARARDETNNGVGVTR